MIDLQKFCSRASRYEINKPWSRGDYTYATDGHILVRVPRIADIPENDKAPDTSKLFAEAIERTDYKWIVAPLVHPEYAECGYCEKGVCDGESCYECHGEGEVEQRVTHRFKVAGKTLGLSSIYLAKICELPNAEIGLTKAAADSWTTPPPKVKPVMFRFSGGDGLLMPVRL